MNMKNILTTALAALARLAIAAAPSAYAAAAEKRMALVIGNGAYQTSALATPANDAGLIAQTLQASGFDVVGARDLDEDSLRHAFRDFVDNVSKAGPAAVGALTDLRDAATYGPDPVRTAAHQAIRQVQGQ